MKKLGNWLWSLLSTAILPIIVFLVPEYADVGEVAALAATVAGTAGIIGNLTEGLKAAVGYDPNRDWKGWPRVKALVIGGFLGLVFSRVGVGFFELADTAIQGMLIGFIASGIAMGFYDNVVGKKLLKRFWGIEL